MNNQPKAMSKGHVWGLALATVVVAIAGSVALRDVDVPVAPAAMQQVFSTETQLSVETLEVVSEVLVPTTVVSVSTEAGTTFQTPSEAELQGDCTEEELQAGWNLFWTGDFTGYDNDILGEEDSATVDNILDARESLAFGNPVQVIMPDLLEVC